MEGDKVQLRPRRPFRWIRPIASLGAQPYDNGSFADDLTDKHQLGKARSHILSSFLKIPSYSKDPRHGTHLFRMLLDLPDTDEMRNTPLELPGNLVSWLRSTREKRQQSAPQWPKQQDLSPSSRRRM